MSLIDILRRIRRTPPSPPPPVPPVLPPGPPPIDPIWAQQRIDAMRRRSEDGLRYKHLLSPKFVPPRIPSIDYYMNNPTYVWDPTVPCPDPIYQPPPRPQIPLPPPIPKPTEEEAALQASALKRWSDDLARYRLEAGKINLRNIWMKQPSVPPPLAYYQAHPEYVWDPNAPRVL